MVGNNFNCIKHVFRPEISYLQHLKEIVGTVFEIIVQDYIQPSKEANIARIRVFVNGYTILQAYNRRETVQFTNESTQPKVWNYANLIHAKTVLWTKLNYKCSKSTMLAHAIKLTKDIGTVLC